MDMEMEDAAVPALAVVDARFCAADAATLAVAKALSMSGSDFAIMDAATSALMLRIDGMLFSLRQHCIIVDADFRPVLTGRYGDGAVTPNGEFPIDILSTRRPDFFKVGCRRTPQACAAPACHPSPSSSGG